MPGSWAEKCEELYLKLFLQGHNILCKAQCAYDVGTTLENQVHKHAYYECRTCTVRLKVHDKCSPAPV